MSHISTWAKVVEYWLRLRQKKKGKYQRHIFESNIKNSVWDIKEQRKGLSVKIHWQEEEEEEEEEEEKQQQQQQQCWRWSCWL